MHGGPGGPGMGGPGMGRGPGMGGPGMGRGPGMRGPGMPPPPPPRWGYRGYRRGGCLGCLLPVLLMGALLAAGIAALLLL